MVSKHLKRFVRYTGENLNSLGLIGLIHNCRYLGIDEVQLVENASRSLSDFISKTDSSGKVVVVCSPGFEGAVALAAARNLQKEKEVGIFILSGPSGNERSFAKALIPIEKSTFFDVVRSAEEGREGLARLLDGNLTILEAISETGHLYTDSLRYVLRAIYGYREKHRLRTKVISLNYPRRVERIKLGDGLSQEPDYIFSLHKRGYGLEGLRSKVVVREIGIPIEAELFSGPGDMLSAYIPRHREYDKRMSGKVVVIGGSKKYHGAPVLAAHAVNNTLIAMKIGAGFARLYVPETILNAARSLSPNIIVSRLGNTHLEEGDVAFVKQDIESSNALVIGMGLGKEKETADAVMAIFDIAKSLNKKTVIDADAIGVINDYGKLWPNAIITPHENEFKSIAEEPPDEEHLYDRASAAVREARELNAIVVLKGHNTIVTDGERVKINGASTAALATMGTGDILSGIIGGYAAAGADSFVSAVAGVHLHSIIGDSLGVDYGKHVIAQDVLNDISKTLRVIERLT